ncbi:efflux RND transporter periplasmic adaptor subunit [Brevundimonas vesicularis]|uniref:efflux RND transporter periplasmic adaptor subunit n=1 Tax=Brevundimonas vesicularis TaxID=41276 RepID=UPI0038D4E8B1
MAHLVERLGYLSAEKRLYTGAVVALGGVLLLGLASGADKAANEVPAEQSIVVQGAPFFISASFTGRIAPGTRIDLTAPFDAAVSHVSFAYGDQVESGQVLFELDHADFLGRRAEAEGAWLKAEQDALKMENWAEGPEVRRASRAVTAAEEDLNDLETKLAETKALLDRGLVPRSEYDGLLRQRHDHQNSLIAAREDLVETLRRGQGGDRRIALLQREVARARYAAVGSVEDAVIRSPEKGVIVRPDQRGEQGEQGIFPGSRVSKGQLLGVIASTQGLDVIFTLDEADLNLVTPGQKAIVTGPGFGAASLSGVLTGVAGEADAAAGSGKARFTARIRLDPLTESVARSVRIGMTAHITIVTYENASALTVPPEAIQGSAPHVWVTVRPNRGGPPQRRTIRIGRVGPSAVEVISGLRAGEIVVWPDPVPSPGTKKKARRMA